MGEFKFFSILRQKTEVFNQNTQDEFPWQNVWHWKEGGKGPDHRGGHPEVEGDRRNVDQETRVSGKEN